MPAQERAAPRSAGAKRAVKEGGKGKGAAKRSESPGGGRSAPDTSVRAASRASKSPIQALKAAVKKAAGSASRKQGKKPRR